jgi:SAM-dependent methyltransferase
MCAEDDVASRHAAIVARHGPWTAHTVHLGDGFYTLNDPRAIASNALHIRRFVQIAADLTLRPIHELRVLDLACLEGQYGIEFALQGAEVVGLEIRDDHIAKAGFSADVLGLDRFTVRKGDIRDLDVSTYGTFDVVLCIGILYHLAAPDVFDVLQRIASVCSRLLILDTHVSDWRGHRLTHGPHTYRGRRVFEHLPWSTSEQRVRKPWASFDNTASVWLSTASLHNALQDTGFTSVYDCGIPALAGPRVNRLTLAAIKGEPVTLLATPTESSAPRPRLPEVSLAGLAAQHLRSIAGVIRAKFAHLRRRS